jgi:hypothetical protein
MDTKIIPLFNVTSSMANKDALSRAKLHPLSIYISLSTTSTTRTLPLARFQPIVSHYHRPPRHSTPIDFITKLCRQQAEVIQNHVNPNVRSIGQGEAKHRKYKRLNLGGGQAYDRSSD